MAFVNRETPILITVDTDASCGESGCGRSEKEQGRALRLCPGVGGGGGLLWSVGWGT